MDKEISEGGKEDLQLGRPDSVVGVSVDFQHRDEPLQRKAGRPKGSKSQDTLFKDQMQAQFERKLKSEFKGVLETVVREAKGGDMTAAKMIFDRVVPVSKAVDLLDLERTKGISVNINMGALEMPKIINPEDIVHDG